MLAPGLSCFTRPIRIRWYWTNVLLYDNLFLVGLQMTSQSAQCHSIDRNIFSGNVNAMLRDMNVVNSGSSMALVIYCVVVVLVTVNRQPTTDDNTDNDVTSQLRAVVGLLTQSMGRIANLERQLAVSVDETTHLKRQLAALSARMSHRGKFRSAL